MEPLSHPILEQIVTSSRLGILLIEARSPGFKIVYANPAYEAQSGYSARDLIGSAWGSHFAERDDGAELIELKRVIACGETCRLGAPFIRKDGEVWRADVELTPLRSPDGAKLVLVQHRRTDGGAEPAAFSPTQTLPRRLGRKRPKIVALERSDAVTGLASLDHFMNLLRRDLSIARREDRMITLMLFEVVELDAYRRTFGANAADSCLRMVGAQLAGTFGRASDLCARCDDTTFVAAIQGQGEGPATVLAARVADKTRNLGLHNPRAKSQRYVTVRSVAVDADIQSDDVDRLLARARQRMDERYGDVQPKSAAS